MLRYVQDLNKDLCILQQCDRYRDITRTQLNVRPAFISKELETYIESIAHLKCVCMHVYVMCVLVHVLAVCLYVCMYMCMHECVHGCLRSVYVRVCASTCVCMSAFMYACVCVCPCVC